MNKTQQQPPAVPMGAAGGRDVVVPSKTQKTQALEALKSIGLPDALAEKLCERHDAKRVLSVVAEATTKKNPPGFARRALEENWTVSAPQDAPEEKLKRKAQACDAKTFGPCARALGAKLPECQFCARTAGAREG